MDFFKNQDHPSTIPNSLLMEQGEGQRLSKDLQNNFSQAFQTSPGLAHHDQSATSLTRSLDEPVCGPLTEGSGTQNILFPMPPRPFLDWITRSTNGLFEQFARGTSSWLLSGDHQLSNTIEKLPTGTESSPGLGDWIGSGSISDFSDHIARGTMCVVHRLKEAEPRTSWKMIPMPLSPLLDWITRSTNGLFEQFARGTSSWVTEWGSPTLVEL